MAKRTDGPKRHRAYIWPWRGAGSNITFDTTLYAVLAEEDLPPGEQPDALLLVRAPAAQYPAVAEEAMRHPEFRDGDPR